MNLDEHASLLGNLIANLQSLEFLLRAKLLKHYHGTMGGVDIDQLKVGDTLDENEFTNYDTLGTLIRKYNENIANRSTCPHIDAKVIALRDALAHGRVSKPVPADHLHIIKFEPPKNGKVRVAFSEEMNEKWMRSSINQVLNEIKKINQN